MDNLQFIHCKDMYVYTGPDPWLKVRAMLGAALILCEVCAITLMQSLAERSNAIVLALFGSWSCFTISRSFCSLWW